MSCTETLPGTQDRRKKLLRCDRGIPGLRRVEAHIAVAAWRDALAEIVQQRHAAAVRRLAKTQQRIELHLLDTLVLGRRFRLLDPALLQHHVREAVRHPRVGRFAVAPRTTGLL